MKNVKYLHQSDGGSLPAGRNAIEVQFVDDVGKPVDLAGGGQSITSVEVSTLEAGQPATAQQLNLTAEERGLPLTIIDNGQLYPDNLRRRGLDRRWLERQLAARGLHSVREVFLMTVDDLGGVYFASKE